MMSFNTISSTSSQIEPFALQCYSKHRYWALSENQVHHKRMEMLN